MTLALTYDATLSRVRIPVVNSAGNNLADTFTRDTTNGWGTANSGEMWGNSGGAAADFLVTTGVGRVAHPTVGIRRFTWAGSYVNVDMRGQVTAPPLAAGASILAGYITRRLSDSNFYSYHIVFGTNGQCHVDIAKRVANTFTTLGGSADQSYTPGTRKWLRVQTIGSRLRVKLWNDGSPEPDAWDVEATDTALPGAGGIGTHSVLLTGNTNTLPVNAHFDNIAPAQPGAQVLVERSVDGGTRWATVRGGDHLDVAGTTTVDDYEFAPDAPNLYRVTLLDSAGLWVGEDTGTITPTLDSVWLKSITRPFLNRPVTVVDFGDISRPSRGGVFDVVGRSTPIAVSDVAGSRRTELVIQTADAASARSLDLFMASGDPVFVHGPADCPMPSMYAVVGDVDQSRRSTRGARRYFTLPLTEVAAPGPGIVGATVTWQSVLNAYAEWNDVLTAEDTWQDALELIGDPSEVIVP